MSKRVVMVGFHFPPSSLSSGHLRLLAFAKYLPDYGWDPLVLTATKSAYEQVDVASTGSIPSACRVFRAPALDAKRHLGIYGKYPAILARPDRWSSWWPGAVWHGMRLIQRFRADAIWSTYPIMTSHCVAYTLHKLTGVPWMADFRDPVATSVEDKPAATVRSQLRWERRVLLCAACSVFTTPGAMRLCAERFPSLVQERKLTIIENGYDDEVFVDLPPAPRPLAGRPLVMVHSGALYPEGRNPFPFFAALARLRSAGQISRDSLKIVLRASGAEHTYAGEIQRLKLEGMVVLAPPVSNRDALAEQAAADALLLFQGAKYDQQIPAKLYEYLRIGRPIFALTGEHGDTAAVLRNVGGAELAPLDDTSTIEHRFGQFIVDLRAGNARQVDRGAAMKHSRREGTRLLAAQLDRIAEDRV